MGLVSKEMIADLIINIINILVLFFLTKALLYKPVKKFLTARRERMEAERQAAAQAQSEAAQRISEYDALLQGAKETQAQMLREAEAEAQAKAREILANAEAQAGEIRKKGEADAQREKAAVLAGARDEVAGLAVDISARILGRELTDADDLSIAKRFFEETEARS